jgi:PAS domain S-box-containing protein
MLPFRRAHIPWLATALGAIGTLAVYRVAAQAEQAGLRAEFQRRTQVIAHTIELSLRLHEETLYSLRNLFHYSDDVTRSEFAGAAAELMAHHPGIQALEWVQRVPGGRRAEVEAAVRAEGIPDFQFVDRVNSGNILTRSPDRPEHFPVLYIHPQEPNRAALGFDMVSGRTWPDLQRAVAEDVLVASGRLPLISDGRQMHWGYIFELPVYQLPIPADAAGRFTALRGFVLGIFQLDDMIDASLRRIRDQAEGIDLLLLDRTAPPDRQFLHYRHAAPAGAAEPPSVADLQAGPMHHQLHLQAPNRTWEAHFRANPAWIAGQRRHDALLVLFAGLAGSLLLGFYLRGNLRRTELVEREVAARTEELRLTQTLLQDDIRHREQIEQELLTSEARLQAIIDLSPAFIFVKDLAGRYVLLNAVFRSRLLPPGFQLEGRTDADLFPNEDAAFYRAKDQEVIAAGSPLMFEETVIDNQGRRIHCLTQKFALRHPDGTAYAVCGIATDITAAKASEQERLRLERQLLEAQKLEALGVLAGGIAHDFNNLLTSVLGNASLTRQQLDPTHPATPQLEQIELAARRAADLCSQMLAYAGKASFVTAPVNLGTLIHDTAALLRVSLHKGTRLELDLAPGLPAVLADATQLRQIVMNLVLNAADAIGPRPDGLITLTTAVTDLSADTLRRSVQPADLPPGRYVSLEVRDNGSGMPPETLARIFEPFFTTKFSGRGLGLSAVLGIVQSHRGALFVESTPGAGTTFRLHFPALDTPAPASASPAPAADSATLRGTVLLVDDEPEVRLVAERVLRRRGLTVHAAASGEAALALCRDHGQTIDVILLDLTMPGLSGEETLRQLAPLGLRARVVIMSGYSESETMARCSALGAAGFLHKPFELDQLLDAVRRWLP